MTRLHKRIKDPGFDVAGLPCKLSVNSTYVLKKLPIELLGEKTVWQHNANTILSVVLGIF